MSEAEKNWGVWQTSPDGVGSWVPDYEPKRPVNELIAFNSAARWRMASTHSGAGWKYEARMINAAPNASEEKNWGVWQTYPSGVGSWAFDYSPEHPVSKQDAVSKAWRWSDLARSERNGWKYEARPLPAPVEKNWGIWFKGDPASSAPANRARWVHNGDDVPTRYAEAEAKHIAGLGSRFYEARPLSEETSWGIWFTGIPSDDDGPGWMHRRGETLRYTREAAENDARAYGELYEARSLSFECPAQPETLGGDIVVARSAELAAAAGRMPLLNKEPEHEIEELAKELFATDPAVMHFAMSKAEQGARGSFEADVAAFEAVLEKVWDRGTKGLAPEAEWHDRAADRAKGIVQRRRSTEPRWTNRG